MLPARLDYLFVARFQDGTIYRQTPQDSSLVHPLTRSAFYDVSQRLVEIKSFSLIARHRRHEHIVFLADGHFVTDGKILPCPRNDLNNFRLIYFRRIQQRQGCDGWHHRPEIIGYFMGWQANDATGKNYQMILQIPPLGSLEKPLAILKG